MLEEYIEDNYYARFDTRNHNSFKEIYLNARLYINDDKRTNGRKDERTDKRTEILAPVSHTATNSCDKNVYSKR